MTKFSIFDESVDKTFTFQPRYILTDSDIESITAEVNKSTFVKIEKVCQIDRQATKLLLEGETSKRKEYRAYCYSDKELTETDLEKLELAELVLNQTTPIRVLHRRNVDVRKRTIHRSVNSGFQRDHIFNTKFVKHKKIPKNQLTLFFRMY